MKKNLFLFAAIAMTLISCTSKTVGKSNCNIYAKKYEKNNKNTIDSINCRGTVIEEKIFEVDSEFSDAFFDSTGNILLWQWYDKKRPKPRVNVFYAAGSKFDSFSGIPFLKLFRKDEHNMYINMVNPPNVTFITLLVDSSVKGAPRLYSDPILSDSLTSWTRIKDLINFEPGHSYKLYAFVIDSNRNEAILIPSCMIMHKDYYEFKRTPPKVSKLR